MDFNVNKQRVLHNPYCKSILNKYDPSVKCTLCFFVDNMSRILVRPANNFIIGALQFCQKCRSTVSFRRGIELFHNKSVKGPARELHWTYQQTLHWRHRMRLSSNLRTLVCPLSTSPPQDDSKHTFKDDPETRSFIRQIHQDFGVDNGIS